MRTLLAVLTLVVAQQALACTCITPQPKGAFLDSEAVFTGTARKVGEGVYELQVDETFKGDATVQTRTLHHTDMCDAYFQDGERYLVYGYRNESGEWHASLCSRTRPLAQAECDVRYIRSRRWWWSTGLARLTRNWRNPLKPKRDDCPLTGSD